MSDLAFGTPSREESTIDKSRIPTDERFGYELNAS